MQRSTVGDAGAGSTQTVHELACLAILIFIARRENVGCDTLYRVQF